MTHILINDLKTVIAGASIQGDDSRIVNIQKLITRAGKLEFDDFKSPHPFPKILLNHELTTLGLYDLAENVVKGHYDQRYE